jgi:predicted ATP-dependent endonuclease of OLD family
LDVVESFSICSSRKRAAGIDKEVFWAGDGLQIWLQLLLHIFRLQKADVIVLDEPDVFLHPDLQRRLVRLLESVDAQTITATHSPELLAEAPPESVVWVDKARRRSIRAPDSSVLTDLMTAIGTQFNIRLARALRAKRVLFLEGNDMKILRHLAEAVDATNLAREADIAIIPLRGYSNWDRIEPFVWLMRDLLREAVEVFIVLDRDYRTKRQVDQVQDRLKKIGVHGHVWRRKELENYLLEPRVVAAVMGVEESEAEARLDAVTADLKDSVTERAAFERVKDAKPGDRAAIRERVVREFDTIWSDPRLRLAACPPKEVLSRVNRALEAEGKKALTFQRLARTMKRDDVPDEVKNLLLRIDGATD